MATYIKNSEFQGDVIERLGPTVAEIKLKDSWKIGIQLHQTVIAEYQMNEHSLTLNSGGWRTITTKKWLNKAIERYLPSTLNCYVYQEKNKWYVHIGHEFWPGTKDWPFDDEIKIYEDGQVYNFQKSRDAKRIERIEKKIDKFVDGLPENIPLPGPGDCWYCSMRVIDTKEPLGDAAEDTEHLISHMKEKYYPGALILNAVKEKGYHHPGFIIDSANKLPSSPWLRNAIKRALKKYLRVRLVDGRHSSNRAEKERRDMQRNAIEELLKMDW